jgi:putative transposase
MAPEFGWFPPSGGADNLLSACAQRTRGLALPAICFYSSLMASGQIFDEPGHAHFITFSCYKRRNLLDDDEARNRVTALLAQQIERSKASCLGFVLMPNHAHCLLWFPAPNLLSAFIQQWKQRSSINLKQFYKTVLSQYEAGVPSNDPVWQRRFYDFNVFTPEKISEKLNYMHNNPVRWNLVADPSDWLWSSARVYEHGKSVNVPIDMRLAAATIR